MVRRFSTLCLCFCAFLQAARAHAEIQVGAASRVITPDPRLTLHAPRFPAGWSRASPATATLQETRKDAVLDLSFRNLARIILC